MLARSFHLIAENRPMVKERRPGAAAAVDSVAALAQHDFAMSRGLHLIQPRRAASSAAVVDKIAIVGLSRVGASLALAAREVWPSALVIGVDTHEVLERAQLRHAVDVGSPDLGIAAEAGLVVLAHDERQNLEILAELPHHVEGAAIVTDTGSTKAAIVEAAGALPREFTFIGGHPLIEPREGGVDAASAELIVGCPWVLIPPDPPNDEAFDRLWAVATGLGAAPALLTAAEHDRLVALLAHLPIMTVAAILGEIDRKIGPGALRFMDPVVASLVRLAAPVPERWSAVCATNAGPLNTALTDLITSLQNLRAHLSDDGWLRQFVARAAGVLHNIPPAD
jgi:prephenate dehydrogenase